MFDDQFLLAAIEGRFPIRQVTILSLRPEDDFEPFTKRGWRVVSAGIMLAVETDLAARGIEVAAGNIDNLGSPVVIGDFAAFSDDRRQYLVSRTPEVVKVNFVSSVIDGGAFLKTADPDLNKSGMLDMVGLFRQLGYTCFGSTWYRDDVEPGVALLDGTNDVSLFPFNLLAVKDPSIGHSMKLVGEIYAGQSRDAAMENAKLIGKLDRKIKERDKYIMMLEDAMLALQPSDKIKIGS
ncbi:MAG: hypothetical protein RIC16_03570 [Rhodospirillales bacterium]